MKRELLLFNDEFEDNNGPERIIPELTLLFDFVLMLQDINKFLNFSQA